MSLSLDPDRDLMVRAALAEILRRARAREGLTQPQLERALAARMGAESVSPATVSRYERGQSVPPLGTLAALCEVLTGRENALVEGLEAAFERPAQAARKRKDP